MITRLEGYQEKIDRRKKILYGLDEEIIKFLKKHAIPHSSKYSGPCVYLDYLKPEIGTCRGLSNQNEWCIVKNQKVEGFFCGDITVYVNMIFTPENWETIKDAVIVYGNRIAEKKALLGKNEDGLWRVNEKIREINHRLKGII